MKIIGLTGSIGMGKSETARLLKTLRISVFEADKTVHQLLAPGGKAAAAVAARFPVAVKNGVIDRGLLGQIVFQDAAAKKALEAIMHSLVQKAEKQFVQQAKRMGARVVVLDIPLLFETGADKRCAAVMVVTAPAFLQAQRVLARPGMNAAKFAAIRAAQMPDSQKRKRADVVIHTGLGRRWVLEALKRFCAQ